MRRRCCCGGQAARAARRDAGPRDVPRRVLGGAVRRPPRRGRRRARGRRGGPRRRLGVAPRGAPRAADLLLDGVAPLTTEGYAAGAPTLKRAAGGVPRRVDARGAGTALAVARVPHRARPRRRCRAGTSSPPDRCGSRGSRRAGAAPARARRARVHAAVRRAAHGRRIPRRRGRRRRRGHWRARQSRTRRCSWRRTPAHEAEAAGPDRVSQPGRRATRRGPVADRDRVDDARCCTTASAGTRRRWSPRSGWRRGPYELGAGDVGRAGADRGGGAERDDPTCGRPDAPVRGDRRGPRHGLGARHRGPLARAGERGRRRRAAASEAIERLSRTRIHVALARAHLLYGEWLRRERRRVGRARAAADRPPDVRRESGWTDSPSAPVASSWRPARRCAGGSSRRATSSRRRRRRSRGWRRDGLSNPEIGAQLFLSARTVEWHLSKVFGKLGIGSRRELRAALSEDELLITSV